MGESNRRPDYDSLRCVDHVVVVIERSIRTGASTVYGVFQSERLARADYGRPDKHYEVQFVWLPVWGLP